jgi:hypothetical protein
VAWNSGDVPRLRNELSQISAISPSSLPALENERMEIVQGVAHTIRIWLGGAKGAHADLNIALTLLRHMAVSKEAAA